MRYVKVTLKALYDVSENIWGRDLEEIKVNSEWVTCNCVDILSQIYCFEFAKCNWYEV